MFDVQEGINQGMMTETNFAVEFRHIADHGMYVRELLDVEGFDAEFRSDGFNYININTEVV